MPAAKPPLTPKRPQQFQAGDRFSFQGKEWTVLQVTDSPDKSTGYNERQWEIQDAFSQGTAYLLLCQEQDGGVPREKWVFTLQIALQDILPSMPPKPPAQLTYRGEPFAFKEEYTTMAADDEGVRVPKVTWDYFDAGGGRNLAVEIWKEPDQDYPEAYLGIMIDASALVYKGRRAAGVSLGVSAKSFGAGLTGQLVLFMLGVPGDWILLAAMPIYACLLARTISPWCLGVGMLSVVPVCALAWANSFLIPAVLLGLAIIGISTAAVCLLAMWVDAVRSHLAAAACGVAYIPASMYSAFMYYNAPGPHTGSQLAAALLVPIFIAGAAGILNLGVKNLWPATE